MKVEFGRTEMVIDPADVETLTCILKNAKDDLERHAADEFVGKWTPETVYVDDLEPDLRAEYDLCVRLLERIRCL